MGRVNTPVLTDEEQKLLEKELKGSDNHAFRMRCQAILLKAAGRKSKDVGQIVGMCHVSVNSWLKRYKQVGLAGLMTKPGRGRKAKINKVTDEAGIIEAVKANRQRISLAKANWEAQRPADSPAVGRDTFRNFFKSLGGRYKRIRRRVRGKPNAALYEHKKDILAQLEALSEQGLLNLFYGDESHVCSEGYVPYGWQLPGEDVFISAQKGFRVNCWGLISRNNECHWATTSGSINAAFVGEKLDALSFTILVPTVVVLDNASIHTARIIQNSRAIWEQRGLYLFFLPPYSPHLNIAETLWRHLKGGWLVPEDYGQNDDLAYALNRCLSNVGKSLKIQFSRFNTN